MSRYEKVYMGECKIDEVRASIKEIFSEVGSSVVLELKRLEPIEVIAAGLAEYHITDGDALSRWIDKMTITQFRSPLRISVELDSESTYRAGLYYRAFEQNYEPETRENKEAVGR